VCIKGQVWRLASGVGSVVPGAIVVLCFFFVVFFLSFVFAFVFGVFGVCGGVMRDVPENGPKQVMIANVSGKVKLVPPRRGGITNNNRRN
jgi:hypothetical protein